VIEWGRVGDSDSWVEKINVKNKTHVEDAIRGGLGGRSSDGEMD